MATNLEKVLSGGTTEARNGAIIKTGRMLPSGKHSSPKERKGWLEERQSQHGQDREREQGRRCRPWREGLVGEGSEFSFQP